MGAKTLQSLNCCCTDIHKDTDNQNEVIGIKRPDNMLCCNVNSSRSNQDFHHKEINKSYYNDLIVMQKIKELPEFDWG